MSQLFFEKSGSAYTPTEAAAIRIANVVRAVEGISGAGVSVGPGGITIGGVAGVGVTAAGDRSRFVSLSERVSDDPFTFWARGVTVDGSVTTAGGEVRNRTDEARGIRVRMTGGHLGEVLRVWPFGIDADGLATWSPEAPDRWGVGKITGSASLGGNQWTYGWDEQQPAVDDRDLWEAATDGHSYAAADDYAARNLAGVYNTGSGTEPSVAGMDIGGTPAITVAALGVGVMVYVRWAWHLDASGDRLKPVPWLRSFDGLECA